MSKQGDARTEDFLRALDVMEGEGIVSDLERLDCNAWSCVPHFSWDSIAARISDLVQDDLFPGNRGLGSSKGRGIGLRLMDAGTVKDIEEARACMASLGLEPSWSSGKMARSCLAFVDAPKGSSFGASRLMDGAQCGYHDCTPGRYEKVELYDVSSCYYRLLCRLPGLELNVMKGRLVWPQQDKDAFARFRFILEGVEDCKLLRNSLWGAGLGKLDTRDGTPFYKGGVIGRKFLPGGDLQTVCALVARTAYELCRLASEQSQAVYSRTDCVITANGEPGAWRAVGLPVRLQAEGAGHIVMNSCYSVGCGDAAKATIPYKDGCRFEMMEPRAPSPVIDYTSQWL